MNLYLGMHSMEIGYRKKDKFYNKLWHYAKFIIIHHRHKDIIYLLLLINPPFKEQWFCL